MPLLQLRADKPVDRAGIDHDDRHDPGDVHVFSDAPEVAGGGSSLDTRKTTERGSTW
jgi:hypothetical protein